MMASAAGQARARPRHELEQPAPVEALTRGNGPALVEGNDVIPGLADVNPDSRDGHGDLLQLNGFSVVAKGADHSTKYGGMEDSDARRLKALEEETAG